MIPDLSTQAFYWRPQHCFAFIVSVYLKFKYKLLKLIRESKYERTKERKIDLIVWMQYLYESNSLDLRAQALPLCLLTSQDIKTSSE